MIDTRGSAALPQSPARNQRHHRRFGPHDIRMGFRLWRRTRPFWGGLWAILGGLICAWGPASAIKLLIASGTTVWMGILVGALISVFGLFLWFAPQQRHLIGVLITVLSVVSLVTSDFGGFLVGMLLGMIGGALGFAWVPAEPRVRKHRFLGRGGRREELPALDVRGSVAEPAVIETTGVEVVRQPAGETAAVD